MTTQMDADGPVVLVAEDDPGMRELYREVLVKQGLRIVETESGADVVDLVRRHVPKMVLLDVRLPGMSGEAIVRALRADATISGIPVIAATGLGGGDTEEWRELGFDEVLFKPIRLRDLIATVRRFVE